MPNGAVVHGGNLLHIPFPLPILDSPTSSVAPSEQRPTVVTWMAICKLLRPQALHIELGFNLLISGLRKTYPDKANDRPEVTQFVSKQLGLEPGSLDF